MTHQSENLQPSLFEVERPCVELRAAQKSELAIVIEVLLREIAAGGVAAGAARGGATLAGGATAAYRAGGASGVATSGLAKGADAVMSPLRRAAGSLKSSFEAGGHSATGEGSPAGADAAASSAVSSAGNPPAWARRMKRAQTMNHGISAAAHAVRSGDQGGGGASVDLSQGE